MNDAGQQQLIIGGRWKLLFAIALLVTGSAFTGWVVLDPFEGPLEDFLEPQVNINDCWSASEIASELDSWTSLTSGDQLKLMQAVCDREANHLRLPFRPIVTTKPMAASTLAQCLGRCVILNENYPHEIDSGWLCARAVAHEAAHCMQHAAVDGLYEAKDKPECYPADEQTIENWEWELSNYKSNPSGYWTQDVEVHARTYSAEAVTRIQAEAAKEGYQSVNPAISNKVLI